MYRTKFVSFVFFLLMAAVVLNCQVQKKPEKAVFEFPMAMKEQVKVDFQKQCLKGEVLYDMHCSQCHNVQVKRKMVVPDFTVEQVMGYDMRLANKSHQSKLD